LEQGRDVFAVPGSVTSSVYEGSNILLREGAIPLLSGENIAGEYEALFPDKIRLKRKELVPLDKRGEERLVKKYKSDTAHNDEKVIDIVSDVEYIDVDKVLEGLDGSEKAVASAIGNANLHVDEIIINTGLPAPEVLTALTMLEINGHVVRGEGNYFSLTETQSSP
ncbi:MAG: hypothetical protein FWC90_03850, partial [Oscillospiraceae bacterium]|nr:hypothetical protein [Oscillospiraceae bacterium]